MVSPVIQATSQTFGSGAAGNIVSTAVFLLLIAFIVVRRISRGMHGSVFSVARLFRTPMMYALFTILLSILLPLLDIMVAIVAGVAGLIAGTLYGGMVSFYIRGSRVLYRRSPVIMAIWLVSFVARVALEFASGVGFSVSSDLSFAGLVVDILLAGSTGLISGESIRIYRKYREYTSGSGVQDPSQPVWNH